MIPITLIGTKSRSRECKGTKMSKANKKKNAAGYPKDGATPHVFGIETMRIQRSTHGAAPWLAAPRERTLL